MTSPTTPPTKPASDRISRSTSSAASRRASDPEARFTRNVTIAFVAIIVAVAVIVLIALAYGFWEANLKPLASVNGTEIGRGEWEDRQRLEAFRADRTETATRAALLAGEIDEELANRRLTAATNARNAGAAGAMETLVDLHYQAAAGRGAGRHAVRGRAGGGPRGRRDLPGGAPHRGPRGPAHRTATGQSTAEDTADARAKAEEALAASKAGTPVADLVDEYSPATAAQDGDIGYGTLDDLRGIDPVWAEALYGLDEGGISEVVESPLRPPHRGRHGHRAGGAGRGLPDRRQRAGRRGRPSPQRGAGGLSRQARGEDQRGRPRQGLRAGPAG